MRELLGALGAIVGVVVVVFGIAILASWGLASLFDAIMGTNAMPIFMLAGGTMGLVSTASVLSKTRTAEDYFGLAILYPVAGAIFVVPVSLLFPNTTATFLEMVQYDGSIYTFAIFGSLLSGVVNAIVGLVLQALEG